MNNFSSFFKIHISNLSELDQVFKTTLWAFLISWLVTNLFYHIVQSTEIDGYFQSYSMSIFYSWTVVCGLLYLYLKTKNLLLGLCVILFRVVIIPTMLKLNDIAFTDIFNNPFLFIDIIFEGLLLLFFAIRLAQLSFHRVQLLNHHQISNIYYFYDFQAVEKKYFYILSAVFFGLFIFGMVSITSVPEFFILGLGALVAFFVQNLGIIYLAWKLVKDEHSIQKTLLLLVPIYNFHQIFIAIRDYPIRYNDYCSENNISTEQLDEQPFIWMAWGLLVVVLLGSKFLFLVFAYFVVVQIVNSKLIDAIQTLSSASEITVDSQKNNEYGLFVAIVAKVTKADGSISEFEAEMVSNLLDDITSSYSSSQKARAVFKAIFDYEKKTLEDVLDKANLLYKKTIDSEHKRLQYFEFLLALAFVDGDIEASEEKMLFIIYNAFQLDETNYGDLLEKFRILSSENQQETNAKNYESSQSTNDPYTILGASSSDTNDEIKSKYRALVKKYHPDIMTGQGLDKEFIELATKKLQQINCAYEQIKHQRAM